MKWLFILLSFNAVASSFMHETIKVDGVQRSYVVKLPDGYQQGAEYPLIIGLHGSSSTWKKFNNGTTKHTLERQANLHQMVLILPQGKDNHWNDGRTQSLNGKQAYDDVKFISRLIDKAIKKYQVDDKKVFVTGMSNGGFMAIRLAQSLSIKIKAIAAVAAQMSVKNKNLTMETSTSMMLINGTQDPIIPFNGGPVKLFKFSKNRGSVLSSQQTVDYFLKANQCHNSPITQHQNKRKFDKTQIEIYTYDDCSDNTQVKFIKVIGGGHTWPGGKQYLPIGLIGRLSREFNASQMIVNFFAHIN